MKLAILTSLLFAGMLAAEDWPQFLGPRRDGTYTGKPLPHWPAAGPKILWKHDIGAGFGEYPENAVADAAAGAGDQCSLSSE